MGADDALNSLLNVGMSGRPSVLKSMAGTAPYLPNDSRTAASRIWNMALSSSNFISVFVG